MSLFKFPCEYPIKVVGHADEKFETNVLHIIRKHIPDLGEGAIKIRPSKNSKYQSMTITIHANSKDHLDGIYHELSACEDVLFVL